MILMKLTMQLGTTTAPRTQVGERIRHRSLPSRDEGYDGVLLGYLSNERVDSRVAVRDRGISYLPDMDARQDACGVVDGQ